RAVALDHPALNRGPPRLADFAPVIDQQVREVDPVLLWHKLHQVLFDLLRLFVFCQTEQLRQARDVRVDYDSRSDAKCVAEHYVRGLASDARQLEQLVNSLRNFTAVYVEDLLTGALNRFCLVAKKAGGVNVLFELGGLDIEVVGTRGIFSEQIGGDYVDAFVGALRRED